MKKEEQRRVNLLCHHTLTDCPDGDVENWLVETWLEDGNEVADALEAKFRAWKAKNQRPITCAEMQTLEDEVNAEIAADEKAELILAGIKQQEYNVSNVNIEELEQKYIAAKQAKEILDRQIDAEIAEAKEAIYAKHQTESMEASKAKNETHKAWQDAVNADNLSKAVMTHPAGTRFFEIKTPRGYVGDSLPKKTGREAVEEIVTATTVFPDTMARYSRPHIGSSILRILKNDGTPSKQIVVRYRDWNWKTQAEYEKLIKDRSGK